VSIVACTRYRRRPIPLLTSIFLFFWRRVGRKANHREQETLCRVNFLNPIMFLKSTAVWQY